MSRSRALSLDPPPPSCPLFGLPPPASFFLLDPAPSHLSSEQDWKLERRRSSRPLPPRLDFEQAKEHPRRAVGCRTEPRNAFVVVASDRIEDGDEDAADGEIGEAVSI